MSDNKIIEFNRSKIYEKLKYQKQPHLYASKIPWTVQQQIAATNGVHYINRVGKLNDYPVYQLPVSKVTDNKLMLDIGNGWGRWLIAGANKGFIPIGLDLRLEFCQTARQVLKDLNKIGYSVVGDLENLPFKNSVFDFVWSFSVIQHTHYNRLVNCLGHINRILNSTGFTKLEFPNKNGLRNKRGPVIFSEENRDNYNSWVVRYYTIEEYKNIFEKYLADFKYENHSFLGIGVLKEDIKYVSFKNKIACSISRLFSNLTNVVPALTEFSDSIYISAKKKTDETNTETIKAFLKLHKANPGNNLNVIPLLRCPKYGGDLSLSSDGKKLISKEAGIYYPIEGEIPILISSEAVSIN